jgi:Na+/H+-dicarboxylate symporter
VPAAVLFSIFLGVGLIGLEERKPLLDSLQALSHALLRVTGAEGCLGLEGLARVSGPLSW